MHLLHTVRQHLKITGTSATRFGREAIGDPGLVFDLTRGRECRPETAARVLAHIERRGVRRTGAAHRELARALALPSPTLRIVAQDYRPWWSATFWGVRHCLTIEADEAVLDAITDDLADREFDLAGHIVVDIAVAERTPGRIAIEALTIEDQ